MNDQNVSPANTSVGGKVMERITTVIITLMAVVLLYFVVERLGLVTLTTKGEKVVQGVSDRLVGEGVPQQPQPAPQPAPQPVQPAQAQPAQPAQAQPAQPAPQPAAPAALVKAPFDIKGKKPLEILTDLHGKAEEVLTRLDSEATRGMQEGSDLIGKAIHEVDKGAACDHPAVISWLRKAVEKLGKYPQTAGIAGNLEWYWPEIAGKRDLTAPH